MPDEELFRVAEKGELRKPGVLEQQVKRMLKDPRSRALSENFAGQWLQLRTLQSSTPEGVVYPDFDDNLRQAFQRETEMLFESILHEDRSVLDLLNADYTFVNERLAKHYDIANVYGPDFRRVPVPIDARRGLLGHGSTLLREAGALAQKLGAKSLFLEVRPSNHAAQALYRRFGFHKVAVRRDYYPAHTGREDALVLTLPLK